MVNSGRAPPPNFIPFFKNLSQPVKHPLNLSIPDSCPQGRHCGPVPLVELLRYCSSEGHYERSGAAQEVSYPTRNLYRLRGQYFSALSRGDPLPVKDRIEMPVATQKTDTGLTQGLLKVLHKQCSHKQYVELADLEKKWKNLCLPVEKLRTILELDPCEDKIEWIKFLALGCSSLGRTLNTAMKNVCEILTSDPEGGPARIPFETFAYVYQYLSGLDPELPAVETENYLTSLRLMSESRKNGMIGLSDFFVGKKII